MCSSDLNEIPTVPMYSKAKPQPRERASDWKAGKEDPVELDSVVWVLLSMLFKRKFRCLMMGFELE